MRISVEEEGRIPTPNYSTTERVGEWIVRGFKVQVMLVDGGPVEMDRRESSELALHWI